MPDVFISYKREQRSEVEKIAERLVEMGFTVWYDASLTAGHSFSDEIDKEARAARVVLVCWSPDARTSNWVRSEALIGFDRNCLAAAYVAGPDHFSPPAPFNSVHMQDLRSWLSDGQEHDLSWRNLLKRIGSLCDRADVEEWSAFGRYPSAKLLDAWLAKHPASVLRSRAEALLLKVRPTPAPTSTPAPAENPEPQNSAANGAVAPAPAANRQRHVIMGLAVVAAIATIGLIASILMRPPPAAGVSPDIWKAAYPWNPDWEEVQKTGSGLQYIVVRSGDPAGTRPNRADEVEIRYDGRLAGNGKSFDANYLSGEGARFFVSGTIPGLAEGLQLMHPGDEFMFWIPADLGYGKNGVGDRIPPNSDLMFLTTLLKVHPTPWAEYMPWPTDKPGVVRKPSGLEYSVITSGDDRGAHPTDHDVVTVHFEARLEGLEAEPGETEDDLRKRTVVQSTFENDEPVTALVSDFTPGFNEVVKLMRKGDRWMVRIPPSLMYGSEGNGRIPPDAVAIYDLRLVDVVTDPARPPQPN